MYGARLVNGVYVADERISKMVFKGPRRVVVRRLRNLYIGD